MNLSKKRSTLPRLLGYTRPHRHRVVAGIIASIANKVFDLAPPVLIGVAVDVVVSQKNSFLGMLGIADVTTQLWTLAVLTLLIWALESLLDYVADLIWRNLAQTVQHELRLDAFGHLETLELSYFEDRSSGELMSILNDDINQLERFLDSGAHDIIVLFTTIIVVGSLFVFFVPELAWMTILPMPIIAVGSIWFQKLLAPRYAAVREQAGVMNAQLSNSIGGISTVKSFTAESFEKERLGETSREYSQRNRAAIMLSSAFVPLIRMVIVVGFAAILIYAGQMVVAGDLNVGIYSILVFMTQRLLWPLTILGSTLDLFQRAMASTERVLNILSTKPQIVDGTGNLPSANVSGKIELRRLSFAYDSRTPVLRDLSFVIEPGTTVGIVGSTGSGKTTIVKLLLRFYEISQGQILLDGVPINSVTLASLREAIALVSQDVFLIDGTIADNITYGSFGASEDRMIAAAKTAEIHDFISELPEGYSTVVGERGQKLSGGQRQRIAIARAVLKDAPVLILDEATSSVDNETEAAIQRAMERISHERTLIIIAHRLSTVRNADDILVLENGQLVESGTHDSLLDRDGIYSSLWSVQTGTKPTAPDLSVSHL